MRFEVDGVSKLGARPKAANHLNGGSFQQDALVTFLDYQYCAYYLDHPTLPATRTVHLSRRHLSPSAASSSTPGQSGWETLSFPDSPQTEDDGHNTISLGICHLDGTLHLAWDCHDSPVSYVRSKPGLAKAGLPWSVESFEAVRKGLSGCESDAALDETTYPRFVSLPEHLGGKVLLELRTGLSGKGDDWIYAYPAQPSSSSSGDWERVGQYLKGVGCNPYVNGVDLDAGGGLHVSWCHRDYVPVTLEQSRQQAGPNGPENNRDLCYATSPFDAQTGRPGSVWLDINGKEVGRADQRPLTGEEGGVTVWNIPKYSGILNQEAQVWTPRGLYVLNRETIEGRSTWFLYHPTSHGRLALPLYPASHLPPRAKLACFSSRLLALLPQGQDVVLLDLWAEGMPEVGRVQGAGHMDQEVLYDRYRHDRLSLFVGMEGEVCVVDLKAVER